MSSTHHNSVTLVIPMYNEQAVLETLIQAVEAFRNARNESIEVILVDDGSNDDTFPLVCSLTAELSDYRIIRFSRNFGHQLAVTAGLKRCMTDAAIILDADLQDPLEIAGQMIDTWKQGVDVVYGIRDKRHGVPVVERLTARWFYRFFRWFTDVNAPVDTGDFRLLSRPVIQAFNDLPEQQPYVRGLIAWLGFNQVGIHYERPPRVSGTTKYPLRRRMALATDGLMSFSSKPLKIAVNTGLVVSLGSIFGLIWTVITKYVIGTAVSGWASLIFTAFFFGGLQLFFLGLVGSYVARVYDEVKNRPRYVVRDIWDSNNFVRGAVNVQKKESMDAINLNP